jgi:hypothetical protein
MINPASKALILFLFGRCYLLESAGRVMELSASRRSALTARLKIFIREIRGQKTSSLLTSHFSLLTSHFSLLTSHFSLTTRASTTSPPLDE